MSYVVRRLASGVLLILALTLATYLVFYTIPANPTCLVLDCGPGNTTTPAQFAAARHELGLDQPVLEQYGRFLWRLVRHGSFGESFTQRNSIGSALEQAVPATASLVLGGALLLVLLALPLGLISALRPHGLLDRGVLGVSLVGIALHPFVVGLLILHFAGRLGIAPPFSGYCPLHGHKAASSFWPGCGGPLDWAFSLYLPWIVFALFFLPLYTRMFRARLLETLREPYVRTARAKGASELRVLGRHVLRNGLLPILPMLAMDVGTAVTTAIYVEAIFKINGLGTLAVNALSGNAGSYDLPTIVGIVFVVACAVVVLNLIADIALVALDPRITGRAGKYGVWRDEEGRLSRRRLVVAVAAAALVGGGVAAAATVPHHGTGRASLATYTTGGAALPDHWSERFRLPGSYGSEGLRVEIQRIVVGRKGWAVTARLENDVGQDLTITPGTGTYARQAGFQLQFPLQDKFGRRAYTVLPALAFQPQLPATLPIGESWQGTFAGPGKLPRRTTIYIGFGLFSAVTSQRPTTFVTYRPFELR